MKRKVLFIIALLCAVAQGAWSENVVNLSMLTSDYVAHDGDVLTGSTHIWPIRIKIAENARVTLSGVSIKKNESTSERHALCIECLGNATIILAEGTTNEIFSYGCPGIIVGPVGTTTTITSTSTNPGKLTIKVDDGEYAYLGIGGEEDCGNIVIENGIIETTGAWDGGKNKEGAGAPGIGARPKYSCGDITIKGGVVTATGGRGGAGIGRGNDDDEYKSECGTITISGGEVHAQGGQLAAGIGGGVYNDGCVTHITGGVVYAYGGEEGAGIGGGGTDEAGKPYIVKWASGDNIESPTFTNVTISTTTPTDITPTGEGSDGSVTFKGTFGPVAIGTDGDNTKLYLGGDNKLYWPSREMSINSFRAYFQLNNITAGNPSSSAVRAFVLNFDGDEETGIATTNYTDSTDSDNAWYDLSGRKLSGKPTTKGLYINNGKKVVIK